MTPDAMPLPMPMTVRISATYPTVPWPCPESVEVEYPHHVVDQVVHDVLATLATVPMIARNARRTEEWTG
jgi:hypothetical protein